MESEFEHDFSDQENVEGGPPDPRQAEARRVLRTFFEQNHQAVFYSRQIEVYQLYPWTERDLATKVRERLGLPVDAPKKLLESTMRRFLDWHARNL